MSCFLLEERHDVSLPFHSCFCPTLTGRFGGGLLWCAGRLGWHAGPVQNPRDRGQWIFITRDHLHETSQESQCKYFHPPCRSQKQLSDYQNDLSTTYHKESEKHEPFCRWIWFWSSCRNLFRNKCRLHLRFLLHSIGLPDYFCHCITKARRIGHESVARGTLYTNSMLKKHTSILDMYICR